jgi:MFS family permease
MTYLRFLRNNAPWLLAGALLSFVSSFGQTFFIAIFAGEIRAEFGLSHGEWGGIYTLGTGASAALMLFAGGMADRFRVRVLGVGVVCLLALACFSMAKNQSAALLPFVIFALRFSGQGMTSHVAQVAMARQFVATRGRALAIATLGFSVGEAGLPLTFAWLKLHFVWQNLWMGAGVFCLCMVPVLLALLHKERTPQSVAETTTSAGMYGRHWTRAEMLMHPLFWSLLPAVMLFPAFGTAFWFHQVHFAAIKGWEHLQFVVIIPIGTLTFCLSTIAFGWAVDRFGCARLLPYYLLPLTVAFTLHWYAPTIAWTAMGVVLMGLAGGGQATLIVACWAEFYGTRNLGSIKAAVAATMVLGSAIGPGLSGWLIDVGVGFEQQLLAYAVSFLLASLVMAVPLAKARACLPIAA